MDNRCNLKAGVFTALALSMLSGCSLLGIGETVTFTTVRVQDSSINLAQFNTIEDGYPVRCRQFLKSMAPAEDGLGFEAEIGKACHRI